MIDGETIVKIRDDVFVTLVAVGVRQALIAACTVMLVSAVGVDLYPGVVEGIGAAIILIVVVGYGQFKTYRDKKKLVLLAKDAPHGLVVESRFIHFLARVRRLFKWS